MRRVGIVLVALLGMAAITGSVIGLLELGALVGEFRCQLKQQDNSP